MQPLTPAERREIERIKLRMTTENTVVIGVDNDNRELWLKVLTMALECNQVLEVEWRKNS